MPLAELLAVLMVVAVCAALMIGYPVALTLAGVSLAFAVLGHVLGVMGYGILGALPQRIFGVMTNEVLLAIPLFIFMGVMLERSRVAEELLETMGRLFGTLRGGLGISAVIVGTLLAAAKGVVGATTVTMGLIMLPAMLRFGYDKRLAAGTVAATATLGAGVSARHRAGAARRPARQFLSGGAARAGQFRAALAHGERSVRRRADTGVRAGGALSLVPDRGRDFLAAGLARAAGRSERAARLRARAQTGSGAGRAASRSSSRCSARSSAASPRRPKRPRSARSARSCSRCARRRSRGSWADDAGGREDHAGRQHDLPDLDRRHHVQPRLPRARRRRDGRARARRSAGRHRRRGAHRDGRDVPARLRDGRLRDHLRRGADRGAARC